mgnify:CR=1 FL=1
MDKLSYLVLLRAAILAAKLPLILADLCRGEVEQCLFATLLLQMRHHYLLELLLAQLVEDRRRPVFLLLNEGHGTRSLPWCCRLRVIIVAVVHRLWRFCVHRRLLAQWASRPGQPKYAAAVRCYSCFGALEWRVIDYTICDGFRLRV